MDISNEAKKVLKTIGAREMTFSQLQKKLGESFPLGSETQLLGQMGLLEDVDGYLSVTDVGIKVAALEGNEIPDGIEGEMNSAIQQAKTVKIDKPGEAEAKYRQGVGVKEPTENDALRQYKEGIKRGGYVPQVGKQQPQGETSDADSPEEPVLEAAEELQEPEGIREVKTTGSNNCPVFGNVSLNFCITMCAGWDNGCGVTDKMAERLKP